MIPSTAQGPGPLTLTLLLLLAETQGLRVIPAPNNCSQPGLLCSVLDSNCFDLSWLHTYDWTPSAPSYLGVTAASKLNDLGQRVAVLQIRWTVSADASIKYLQGAEISVTKMSTNAYRCVQIKFDNEFPAQRDGNRQPWRFFYDDVQVEAGSEYIVTVQHLPKDNNVESSESSKNSRSQQITVPGCMEKDMILTHDCCQSGHCWSPNISLEVLPNKLIVSFTCRGDDASYHMLVRRQEKFIYKDTVLREPGAPSDRLRVPINTTRMYDACLYSVEIWPDVSNCSDCVRKKYSQRPCQDPTPYVDVVPGRLYLWAIAAACSFLVFTAIMLVLYYYRDCRYRPGFKPSILPPPAPPPAPTKRKVWLVYSADHRRYVDAVIKLADYLRGTWGMDVILDRLHVQEIGAVGAMMWLCRQKQDIEKSNGTIVFLCSRGAQEKWKAMQDKQGPRVTLRSDIRDPFGDLFTPAMALIFPDFQKAKPYDRYVVAYFSDLFDLGHVPSPLEICPIHPLPENLQSLFFRIQRYEQYQPNVELTVGEKTSAAYGQLMRAIDRCQRWQETHPDWFHVECSQEPLEDSGSSEEDEVEGGDTPYRVKPLIRRPETSVIVMNPILVPPDPVLSTKPTIMLGRPAEIVDPLLRETDPTVAVVQPLLHKSTEVFIQDPYLRDAEALPDPSQPLLAQDVSVQPGHHLLSMDYLMEAQKQLFYNSFLQEASGVDLDVTQPSDVYERPPEGQCEAQNMPLAADTYKQHPPQSGDQGYYTWRPNGEEIQALKESSLLLFMRNGGLPDHS